jgi:hypothetical protein
MLGAVEADRDQLIQVIHPLADLAEAAGAVREGPLLRLMVRELFLHRVLLVQEEAEADQVGQLTEQVVVAVS